jgi:hypothetical protein
MSDNEQPEAPPEPSGTDSSAQETSAQIWKRRLLLALAYLVLLLFAALLGYGVVQAWLEEQASRIPSSVGFGAILLLLVLCWKRLAPWSRAQLLFTYLIVLIGAMAFLYTPRDQTSFLLGPVPLSLLVNAIVLASLLLSLFFLLRIRVLPRGVKIAVGLLGLIGAAPFGLGLYHGFGLPDVLHGEGLPMHLPLWAQPAVLAVAVLLPVLTVFLLIGLYRSFRDPQRSALRAGLALVAALVPLAVGLATLVSEGEAGVVMRTFAGNSYGIPVSQQIVRTVVHEWAEPPEQAESFWVEWEGSLRIPETGVYGFRLDGDGTGFFYLDGQRLITAAGGYAELELDAGLHELRAASVQEAAEGSFKLVWMKKGDAEILPIDPRFLVHARRHSNWHRSPRQAAQVGIDWLQSASVSWQRGAKCFGCHVQGQVMMGLSLAEKNQYRVNREYFDELFAFTRDGILENGPLGGDAPITSNQFAAMGLAYVRELRSIEDENSLQASAEHLLAAQSDAGSIASDHEEPPIDQGAMAVTANSVVAFQRAFEETGDERFHLAVEKALGWVGGAEVATTQDKIFRLITVGRNGTPEQKARLQGWIQELKNEQSGDGGWKESADMEGSNGYATGQVLYAFKEAGVSVNDRNFKKGVHYLLETQQLTGAWPAINTHTHRPSEFAPTMWAVIGLAGSFGSVMPAIQSEDCRMVSGQVPFEVRVTNFTSGDVESVRFQVDSQELEASPVEGEENLYAVTWDSSGAAKGAHTLLVKATTNEGESGEDSTVVYIGGNFSVKISEVKEGQLITKPFTCRAEVGNSTELPVEGVEFLLDDTPLGVAGLEPFELPCDFTQREQGAHVLSAVARGCGLEARDELHIQTAPDRAPGFLQVQLESGALYLPPDTVEVVLDMSGSMWGQIDRVTKVEIAREVLAAVLQDFPREGNIALRVYGHRRKGDCTDSELIVAPSPVDPEAIMSKVNQIRPKGKTPIEFSLRQALQDLDGAQGSKAIILLTDGIETCDGDPVRASKDLIAAGLNLRVHVIGFDVAGSPETVAQLEEVAAAGQGKFLLAENAEDLSRAMLEAVQLSYSVYDEDGQLVYTRPLGPETNELLSGNYRVEIALDPPLALDVNVEREQTTLVEVIRDGGTFRIEQR